MKKIVILCIAVLVSAQMFAIGVKGGLNVANFFGNDAEDMSPVAGFQIGVYSPVASKSFVDVQSELLFTTKGSVEEFEYWGDEKITNTYQLSYLELPVLLKVQIPGWIRPNVYAGGYGAILLSSQLKTEASWGDEDETTDIYDDTNPVDYGMILGAGIDLKNITLDARYNIGLNDVYKKIDFGYEEYQLDAKNVSFTISVGVTF
jgi:hypothetical protein